MSSLFIPPSVDGHLDCSHSFGYDDQYFYVHQNRVLWVCTCIEYIFNLGNWFRLSIPNLKIYLKSENFESQHKFSQSFRFWNSFNFRFQGQRHCKIYVNISRKKNLPNWKHSWSQIVWIRDTQNVLKYTKQKFRLLGCQFLF